MSDISLDQSWRNFTTGLVRLGFSLRHDNVWVNGAGVEVTFTYECARSRSLELDEWYSIVVRDSLHSIDYETTMHRELTAEALLRGFHKYLDDLISHYASLASQLDCMFGHPLDEMSEEVTHESEGVVG
jgi:hypothetical protein